MQNNVFLRLAQERYTTKHYNLQVVKRSLKAQKRSRHFS